MHRSNSAFAQSRHPRNSWMGSSLTIHLRDDVDQRLYLHASMRRVIEILIGESIKETPSRKAFSLGIGGSKPQSDAAEYENSTKGWEPWRGHCWALELCLEANCRTQNFPEAIFYSPTTAVSRIRFPNYFSMVRNSIPSSTSWSEVSWMSGKSVGSGCSRHNQWDLIQNNPPHLSYHSKACFNNNSTLIKSINPD